MISNIWARRWEGLLGRKKMNNFAKGTSLSEVSSVGCRLKNIKSIPFVHTEMPIIE